MISEESRESSAPATSWSGKGGRGDAAWTIAELPDRFVLTAGDSKSVHKGKDVERLYVRRRWYFFWGLVEAIEGDAPRHHRGLSKSDAQSLREALQRFTVRVQALADLKKLVKWAATVSRVIDRGVTDSRWIAEKSISYLESSRPKVAKYWNAPFSGGAELAASLTADEHAALATFNRDLRSWLADVNEDTVQRELTAQRDFFEQIETSPLTEEQARAVICFDNAVNVVASAGSGKTSIMVARAAYAILRGFVPANRILLLAFNKAAAKELEVRVSERLGALGISTDGLRASTFHSFGLGVIGDATGKKPRLASWLDGGQDTGMILRIVDELREESAEFRFKWDLYRLLYGRIDSDLEGGECDAYDSSTKLNGFLTYNGEVVRSQGERLIADWLFLNGVEYSYEHPYSVDVATPEFSQYRPDFYYPSVDVWHEHWAIGYDGKPPKSFTGYAAGMKWKKEVHRTNNTTLVETTWANIIDSSGFPALATDLEGVGLELDWNPERPTARFARPIDHKDLARLVRTFMSHVKSNSLTRVDLEARIAKIPKKLRCHRDRVFVDLYWDIHDRWEQKLRTDQSVDFEDMLVRAAQHVEDGESTPQYDLVLVDEFQDASQARARLVAALVKPEGKYLLAVGDDWQAINRFAGADIAVMTEFESWFGSGHTLQLQTTFRCTQEICDVSSAFVSKNPSQLAKTVRSAHPEQGESVLFLQADAETSVSETICSWLDDLAVQVADGVVTADRDEVVTVDVLGRYNFDRDLVPNWSGDGVDVRFRTIHGAKGLEADYVIVPNLGRGRYGFPSQIADDPVLELAMPNGEEYPHSEERRLFYVALTRARRQAILVGTAGAESPFLVELLADGLVATIDDGKPAIVVCPKCHKGTLVARSGPYGDFLGCTSFPRCRHTQPSTH